MPRPDDLPFMAGATEVGLGTRTVEGAAVDRKRGRGAEESGAAACPVLSGSSSRGCDRPCTGRDIK